MERTLTHNPNGFGISVAYGRPEDYDDIDFDVEAVADGIHFWTERCIGRDRDNYPDWDQAEITLNEDEARELLLLLTVWLERRADA